MSGSIVKGIFLVWISQIVMRCMNEIDQSYRHAYILYEEEWVHWRLCTEKWSYRTNLMNQCTSIGREAPSLSSIWWNHILLPQWRNPQSREIWLRRVCGTTTMSCFLPYTWTWDAWIRMITSCIFFYYRDKIVQWIKHLAAHPP